MNKICTFAIGISLSVSGSAGLGVQGRTFYAFFCGAVCDERLSTEAVHGGDCQVDVTNLRVVETDGCKKARFQNGRSDIFR